jgi:hypothetical protein
MTVEVLTIYEILKTRWAQDFFIPGETSFKSLGHALYGMPEGYKTHFSCKIWPGPLLDFIYGLHFYGHFYLK